ncbi:MAG TPA: alkane 1-monooxygenase [Solimonas sp.]
MPALIYPALLMTLLLSGGAVAAWAMALFNIVFVPMLDQIVKWQRPGWQVSQRHLRQLFAPIWFWCYALAQAGVLIYALALVSRTDLGAWAFMGLVSGVGLMTGTAGITAAHELIHRRSRRERGLGLALLAMVSYLHFRIEHVYGHHRHVGTAHDPASAKAGDTFPTFFGAVLLRGIGSAWAIEAGQRRRRGLPVLGFSNRMIRYALVQTLIFLMVWLAFGPWAVLLFLLQSLMAVHLLEAVNFVQHYGLRRCTDTRIGASHAWDSDDPICGLLVFNLNRHAQHHLDPRIAAADLQVTPQAPRLPYSFFLMVFLALIPPLWRRVIDARLADATASHAGSPSPGGMVHA